VGVEVDEPESDPLSPLRTMNRMTAPATAAAAKPRLSLLDFMDAPFHAGLPRKR
jgi:hypothetical protein